MHPPQICDADPSGENEIQANAHLDDTTSMATSAHDARLGTKLMNKATARSQNSTSIPDPPTPLRTAGGTEAGREHGPPPDRTRDVKRGRRPRR